MRDVSRPSVPEDEGVKLTPTYQPLGPCACKEEACTVVGTKLQKALPGDDGPAHLVRCNCRRHRNKRNQKKGRRAQGRGYRRLGGTAPFSPGHEENQGVLSVEVAVEAKAGNQIPRSLLKFARTGWARRAWSQAERSIPTGVQAEPSIYVEVEGWELLVTLLKRGRG